MVEIEFNYLQTRTKIQASLNDSFKSAITKFIDKTKLNLKDIYFLYNGNLLNDKDIIKNRISRTDKQNKKLIILVMDTNNPIENDEQINKSKNVICSKCKEPCKYNIKDYRIKLFDCKNGHIYDNIKLTEFINTQKEDMSKIKCDICKNKTRADSYKHTFFFCIKCKMNLCPLCRNNHDKSHDIIDYDDKNYKCNEHNESFNKYCENCKVDLCLYCISEHKKHKIVAYEDKLIDTKVLIKSMDDLKNAIKKFKDNLDEIINKFKKIIESIDAFYNINNDIVKYYEKYKPRNYFSLLNLQNIKVLINKEINKIKYDYNYGYNLNRMLYLYNELNDENTEIELNYNPNNDKENNKEKLRIFGNKFVINNIYKCKILYKNEKYELKKYFEKIDSSYDHKNPIKFKLKGVNNITNMTEMFNECYLLSSLPDISKWDTSNVTNMSCAFAKCKSLNSFPDISKWNTKNVIDMSYMFRGCNSITSLTDLSNWDTSNVTNLSGVFYECNSLSSLPDLAKWNISNVNDMRYMFAKCKSLSSLPDLSKCNTINVTDMSYMFYGCNKLKKLPDLAKWNTVNATNLSYMFCECNSLSSLPDIDKWNTNKAACLISMFKGCDKSLKIPSKFNQ